MRHSWPPVRVPRVCPSQRFSIRVFAQHARFAPATRTSDAPVLRMFPEPGPLFYGVAGCAGRNDTNGWLRTKSFTAVSELKSPQPRIRVTKRTRRGCWRRNSTTTPTLSSSERKRCSGAYDSRPIWICSAGWARTLANPVSVRAPARADDGLPRLRVVRQRHRTVSRRFPVFRPACVTNRKVRPRSQPHPR